MISPHQTMIHTFIRHVARGLRMVTLLERMLVCVSVVLVVLLLGAGLFPLTQAIPLLVTALALLSIGAVGVVLVWLVRACLQRSSLEAAALYVEAKHPEVHNNLISALQLPASLENHPETGISRPLVERLLEVTRQQIEVLTRQQLVDWGGVWQQARVTAPLVV
ncbi:MAG: hypothetical protein HYZ81_08790, partial [Nitrospinae bacterium]|nr:hypothetical protein [Nitrospinota bacterium]